MVKINFFISKKSNNYLILIFFRKIKFITKKMSLGTQETVRQPSEMEGGGLSGPANSVESIDCGCGQLYQLSGLVKFATRRTFIILLCSIGVIQAASHAYFHVVSSTMGRLYNIDPVVMGMCCYYYYFFYINKKFLIKIYFRMGSVHVRNSANFVWSSRRLLG